MTNPRAGFAMLKREFYSLFFSPIAYIVIVVYLVISGWFFFPRFFNEGRAEMRLFFAYMPIIFSFTIAALTMRSFSEEYRNGTYLLLRALPLSIADMVIGKFLASLAFVLVMLAPTFLYPLLITGYAPLNGGVVLAGYIGAVFLAAQYCAIGVLVSSATTNQINAFIITALVTFFLAIIDLFLSIFPNSAISLLRYLGSGYHFNNIARGVIDSRDIFYFVSGTFLALLIACQIHEERN